MGMDDSNGDIVDSHSNPEVESETSTQKERAARNLKRDKIRQYIVSKNVQTWIELDEMRKKIWHSEEANQHFAKQRENADTSNLNIKTQIGFLKMMLRVAEELQGNTGIFTSVRLKNPRSVLAKPLRALDTCMAPGAFTQYFVSQHARCKVDGLTLPVESGGHEVLLLDASQQLGIKRKPQDINPVSWTFTDVTLHQVYLPHGQSFPEEFPDKDAFDSNPQLPPHLQSLPTKTEERIYDFVISDGAYLRNHKHGQIRLWEPARLIVSQLILGLSFIKPGGSMLILLHNLESWHSFATIYRFSRFSDVAVYKPAHSHGIRSSFYLMVRNVQPESDACKEWVELLKHAWYTLTFGGEGGLGRGVEAGESLDVDKLLEEWGEDFVIMGEKVWTTQRDALKKKGWVK